MSQAVRQVHVYDHCRADQRTNMRDFAPFSLDQGRSVRRRRGVRTRDDESAVIGGIRLIGAKTIPIPRQGGYGVVAASPRSGVNSVTVEGLRQGIAGAQAVFDLRHPRHHHPLKRAYDRATASQSVSQDRAGYRRIGDRISSAMRLAPIRDRPPTVRAALKLPVVSRT